jgi:hypothetical protein
MKEKNSNEDRDKKQIISSWILTGYCTSNITKAHKIPQKRLSSRASQRQVATGRISTSPCCPSVCPHVPTPTELKVIPATYVPVSFSKMYRHRLDLVKNRSAVPDTAWRPRRILKVTRQFSQQKLQRMIQHII